MYSGRVLHRLKFASFPTLSLYFGAVYANSSAKFHVNIIMAVQADFLEHPDLERCMVCNTRVHMSNFKNRCELCFGLVHAKCVASRDGGFYCGLCLSQSLPFLMLEDSAFLMEIGLSMHALRTKISNIHDKKFVLNPFENIDNKLINNDGLDADDNYYNDCFSQNLGYVDTDQLNTNVLGDGQDGQPSIMHLNARNLVTNINSFAANLDLLKRKFCVIAVSETWTSDSTEECIKLPGYNKIVKSRQTRRGGGLAIYTDSDLNITVKNRPDLAVQSSNLFESLFVQISNLSNKDILVGVIYKPPNTNTEEFVVQFSGLLEKLNEENRPTYLLGDYNIDLLKCNTTHSQTFLNQFLSYGFFPAIDRPTRITDTTATLIDNIYTNVHHKNIKSCIWLADISDHLPICATIPGRRIMKPQPVNIYKYKRFYSETNMEKFKNKLIETSWTEVHKSSCTNTKYNCFMNTIDQLHNSCFPLTKIKTNLKADTKPWISPTLLNCIRKKNNLYKTYLNNKSQLLLEKYKKYKNKLTSILRQAEKDYFSNKLSETKNNLAKTWKIINNITNRAVAKHGIDQIEIGGLEINNPLSIAEKFNNFFTNVGPELAKKIVPSSQHPTDFLRGDYCNSMFLEPTTEEEIIDIITNLKNSSSTGQDNIPIKLIKLCKTELAPILSHINNQSLSDGIFPDPLKIAKVVPIYKNGDIKCVSNYRPISILPSFSKITEKLIYTRLDKYLTKNSILHQNQFGFRSKLSTSMALLELIDNLSKSIDDRKLTLGVFIDLAKAFDTVDHRVLLSKLQHYGIRGIALSWFQNYLTNRKQYTVIDNAESSQSLIKCGVPQGSILGPILFLIYI